jgi:hypothetical protein
VGCDQIPIFARPLVEHAGVPALAPFEDVNAWMVQAWTNIQRAVHFAEEGLERGPADLRELAMEYECGPWHNTCEEARSQVARVGDVDCALDVPARELIREPRIDDHDSVEEVGVAPANEAADGVPCNVGDLASLLRRWEWICILEDHVRQPPLWREIIDLGQGEPAGKRKGRDRLLSRQTGHK